MIRHMKSPQSPKFFRCGLRAAAATMALLLCSITFAQNYPTKPVRMVIGYPPGGASDIVGRVLAGKIQESLGQSVIVENRPGANANIGAEYVAKSPADGYTLGFGGGGPLTANGFLYKKLNYNPARDFVMVATVAKAPLVLAVNPSVGATTLRDLVALFKSKPGAYSYGTPGGGSPQHLTTAMFMSMTGTQLVHIPYKGATPMLNDLVGGQVHIGFDNLGMLPYVKSGRLLAMVWPREAGRRSSPTCLRLPRRGCLALSRSPGTVYSRRSARRRRSSKGSVLKCARRSNFLKCKSVWPISGPSPCRALRNR